MFPSISGLLCCLLVPHKNVRLISIWAKTVNIADCLSLNLVSLELPGDDEDNSGGGVEAQVLQELDHSVHPWKHPVSLTLTLWCTPYELYSSDFNRKTFYALFVFHYMYARFFLFLIAVIKLNIFSIYISTCNWFNVFQQSSTISVTNVYDYSNKH